MSDLILKSLFDLTDISWHPLLKSTNVPLGLVPKPGLIFQAMPRFWPIPIQIFVERVNPKQVLSIRVLAIPGIEERVTYQVESTVCGSYLSYSVTLRGWLSPLIWLLSRPYVDRVARALIESVENRRLPPKKSLNGSCFDF